MDVGSHQYAVVCRHSEEGDEADPYGYTQVDGVHLKQIPHIDSRQGKVHEPVLPVQPEQDETTGKSHEYTGEMNQRCGNGLELEIQNQEDDQQGQGNDDHQPGGGAFLLFVVSGKFIGDAFCQFQFSVPYLVFDHFCRFFHNVHFSLPLFLVEDHVADEEGVFALDHLGSPRIFDIGEFLQRYLCTGSRRD